MRKKFLSIVGMISLLLLAPTSLFSQEREILCCRLVCDCGPKSYLCDYMKKAACKNLDGWEVEDCSQCGKINYKSYQKDPYTEDSQWYR